MEERAGAKRLDEGVLIFGSGGDTAAPCVNGGVYQRLSLLSWTLWRWEQYGKWLMVRADVLGDLLFYRRAHSRNNGSRNRDEEGRSVE